MAKNNFYKTKQAPPYYQEKNKMRLSATFALRNVGGVYLIFKKDVLIYCGFSRNNLYRTLYRHFQEWGTSTQTRVVYKNLKDITVRVIYCRNGEQAEKLEKAIIIKHQPKDNPEKYKRYTTDKKEEEIYNLVTNEKEKDLIVYDGEPPF